MKTRKIPEAAIAALVLGGCGSSDDPAAEYASSFCRAYQSCDPEQFDYDYDSLSGCVEYTQANFAMELEGASEQCERASIVFFRCLNDQFADSCDYEAGYGVCDAEFQAVFDACGEIGDL